MGRLGIAAGLCLAMIAGGCGESTHTEDRTTSGGSAGEGAGADSGRAGSGGAGARGGAGGNASGGSSGAAGSSAGEFFIEGRVDGELVRVDATVRAYWFQGLLQGYIYVEALSDELGWSLIVTNYEGNSNCGSGTITLVHTEGNQTTYHLSDPFNGTNSGCSVLVEHAAPNVGDVIEGTFSGELKPLPGDPNATVSVTEGAFRAPRIADGVPP
jgi:hypothetical protein